MWIQQVKAFVTQLQTSQITEPRTLKTLQNAVQIIPRLADLGAGAQALERLNILLTWTEFKGDLAFERLQAFANALLQNQAVASGISHGDDLVRGISHIATGNNLVTLDVATAAGHFEQAMLCLGSHPIEQLKARVWYAITKGQTLRKADAMWVAIQKDAIAAGVRAFNPYLHATISRAQIASLLESHDLAYEQYQFALRVAKQLPLNALSMDCFLRSAEWYLDQGDFSEVLFNLDPLDVSNQTAECQAQCATLRLSAMRALEEHSAIQDLLRKQVELLRLPLAAEARGALVDEMLICYLSTGQTDMAKQLVVDVTSLPIHAKDETQDTALELLREEISLYESENSKID